MGLLSGYQVEISRRGTRLSHAARGPRLLVRSGKRRFPHLVGSIDVRVCHVHRTYETRSGESAMEKVAEQFHNAHREWKHATV